MALKYTTMEALRRRLETRLQLGGVQETLGKLVADECLIHQQLGPQVAAKMELWLSKCPDAKPSAALLASIQEKGIASELLPVKYLENGAEGGLRKIMYNEFIAELTAICPAGVPGQLELNETESEGLTLVKRRKPICDYRIPEAEMPPYLTRQHREDADNVRW